MSFLKPLFQAPLIFPNIPQYSSIVTLFP
jgi:hypothetical protein